MKNNFKYVIFIYYYSLNIYIKKKNVNDKYKIKSIIIDVCKSFKIIEI